MPCLGKITDNTADGQGGGVYSSSSTFELKDVSITGNKTDTFGGGIYVFSAQVKISGEVIIYNNSNITDGTPDNFYAGGSADRCVFIGNLTGNSKIGYKTTQFYQPTDEKTIQISATETDTEYYKTTAQYFSSDEGHGIRANDNGYLELYRTHTHSWSSTWSSDNTHHWHECNADGCPVTDNSQKDGYAAHTYDQKVVSDTYLVSAADCTTPAEYYYSCACGAAGTESFTEGTAKGHSWGNWHSNGNGTHTRTCQNCTVTDTGNCTGGTATCTNKAVCDICGEEYEEVNASNHTNLVKTEAKPATHMTEGNIEYWYCDGCDKYFSDEAGTKEIALANTVIPKLTEHTADGTGWHSDESSHWNTCECGEKLNEAAHTFEWVIDKEATATEKGLRHEKCTVCGYEKAAVEIPATGTPSDTDTSSPQTGDDSNIALWIVVMFAAGAVLTGTVVYSCRKKYRK